MFTDRYDAGARLTRALVELTPDCLVLGIPRGGVAIAAAMCDVVDAEMDVIIAHKLGAPHNPELAIGGIGPDGAVIIDEAVVASVGGVEERFVHAEAARQADQVARRMRMYRGDRPPLDVHDRICVIVDDGIATGSTMRAAAMWTRVHGASRVIVAVPVAPADAHVRLAPVCDSFVALRTPTGFAAVGQFYDDFSEVTDEQVLDMLRGHARST
jgi:putative phosphoribosyl transferase